MDPRPEAINRKLAGVKRVICVASGKGGVGKSMVSSVSALALARTGCRVGLLDLDLHGPSAHTILGVKKLEIKEGEGIIPPKVHSIEFMSILPFIGENPSLLRGADISNAVSELLAITRWGDLDYLIVDMPPGTGDEVFDVLRLIKKAEFLLVSTPSKIALETVKRLAQALKELHVQIVGIIENMAVSRSFSVKKLAAEFRVQFLGTIAFDESLERAVGNPARLSKTRFARDLQRVLGESTMG